ncbi:hypothetical protein CGLO_03240 [Colletotrichum gloeosporioides Cg-14]|uniref:Uncharacterized protein n=1 Tax=Colletotrichum gloeosporioides (strain Cg-14) TaxID=1237896 RepID=T0LYS8_COLGC|nr:hypothetical protein CGLO_03240 [Colletotrichum gloeosporioides Cg-14]
MSSSDSATAELFYPKDKELVLCPHKKPSEPYGGPNNYIPPEKSDITDDAAQVRVLNIIHISDEDTPPWPIHLVCKVMKPPSFTGTIWLHNS